MKVLMVCDMIMHGGAKHTRLVSESLRKKGVEVEIASYSKSPEFKTIPSVSLPNVFYKLCTNKKRFAEILNESRPDIVHMHHCAGSLELMIERIKSTGLGAVGTVHISPGGGRPVDRAIGFYFRRFLARSLRKSDRVICVSRYVERRMNEIGVDNTQTIYNGIDPETIFRVHNAREILGIPEDDTMLLFVGRLSPEKGINTLFKAFKKLEGKKLYVVGSGPMERMCRSYARQNRNVIFVGKVDESELRLYYSAANLTVVPSLWNEAFGMVNIESMRCGTPPVASALGAIPEIVDDGKNGFLVKDITPGGFAKRISEALGSDLEQIGKNGERFVGKEFFWDSIAEQTKKVYESALS
jgi:glycosyltransferase involved in cell wall biosynthesis